MDVATTPTFLAAQYGLHGKAKLNRSEGKGKHVRRMSHRPGYHLMVLSLAYVRVMLRIGIQRLAHTSLRQAIDSGGCQSILNCATCCFFSERQPVDLVPAIGPHGRSSSWSSASYGARHKLCKLSLSLVITNVPNGFRGVSQVRNAASCEACRRLFTQRTGG